MDGGVFAFLQYNVCFQLDTIYNKIYIQYIYNIYAKYIPYIYTKYILFSNWFALNVTRLVQNLEKVSH